MGDQSYIPRESIVCVGTEAAIDTKDVMRTSNEYIAADRIGDDEERREVDEIRGLHELTTRWRASSCLYHRNREEKSSTVLTAGGRLT